MCHQPHTHSTNQGRTLLESAAITSSYEILRHVYDRHPCPLTLARLISNSSIKLPPKTCKFFVGILRERAAAMQAPHVHPEPPELAGLLLALRRCEVRWWRCVGGGDV
jgi:hypothetical protein